MYDGNAGRARACPARRRTRASPYACSNTSPGGDGTNALALQLAAEAVQRV
eukprot:COSAG02_NODE_11944_length_1626_cov_186.479371_4_plen_50_part_01